MQGDDFNPVVVLPTFNNARTVGAIIARVLETGLPTIVVDDGCTDSTNQVLEKFENRIQIVRHRRNRGKGAALRSGFVAALAAGRSHAVTLDTDGQLNPEQIPEFIEASGSNPAALVIGVRDIHASDYPARSRIGRSISNFLVLLESGTKVADSQCGFRVYPLGLTQAVKCSTGHFGFETEIVTRSAWARCKFVEIPVTCTYSPPGGRVTHFRPFVDSLRAALMHARLIGRAFWPWGHAKWPVDQTRHRFTWRHVWNWISPRQAWKQLRRQEIGPTRVAVGVGIGVLIANLPIYPGQTLASLYTARRLRLNPLSVILGNQISTPPINFALIGVAIMVGHFIIHGSWPALSWLDVRHIHLWRTAEAFILDWIIGGIVLGLLLGAAAFGIVRALLACLPPRPPASQKPEPVDLTQEKLRD